MVKVALACLALLPAPAAAGECPWLGADVAEKALLEATTEVTVDRHPGFARNRGLDRITTCRFRQARELVGHLTVIVMEFDTYEAATEAYGKELEKRGAQALPSKIGASPAFLTLDPGVSGSSCAVEGKRLVLVTHVFSRRVGEAMGKDPDGAVLSTHEVARRVLGRLQEPAAANRRPSATARAGTA